MSGRSVDGLIWKGNGINGCKGGYEVWREEGGEAGSGERVKGGKGWCMQGEWM